MDAASRTADSATLNRIVQSARECFIRLGVRKTRIADVANGAGMVRQTVYDSVSGRDELVALAIRARGLELTDAVRRTRLNPSKSVGDQLVGVLSKMVEMARNDNEFQLLIEALAPERAFSYLVGPSPLTEVTVGLMKPLLTRAHAENSLRSDVGIDEMVEWMQTLLAPLMSRSDLKGAALRRTVKLFVLPTLLRA